MYCNVYIYRGTIFNKYQISLCACLSQFSFTLSVYVYTYSKSCIVLLFDLLRSCTVCDKSNVFLASFVSVIFWKIGRKKLHIKFLYLYFCFEVWTHSFSSSIIPHMNKVGMKFAMKRRHIVWHDSTMCAIYAFYYYALYKANYKGQSW